MVRLSITTFTCFLRVKNKQVSIMTRTFAGQNWDYCMVSTLPRSQICRQIWDLYLRLVSDFMVSILTASFVLPLLVGSRHLQMCCYRSYWLWPSNAGSSRLLEACERPSPSSGPTYVAPLDLKGSGWYSVDTFSTQVELSETRSIYLNLRIRVTMP